MNSFTMDTIGKRIKFLRFQLAVPRDTLASALGVSQTAIAKWENDTTKPKQKHISGLARYFDISEEFILNGKMEISSETKQFLEEYKETLAYKLSNLLHERTRGILDNLTEREKELLIIAFTKSCSKSEIFLFIKTLLTVVENQFDDKET